MKLSLKTPQEMKSTIKIASLKEPERRKLTILPRRTLSGDVIVADHPDFDILLKKSDRKVIVYPKVHYSDFVYYLEENFMDMLKSHYLIKPETIYSSNIYGSLEAEIVDSAESKIDPFLMILLFIDDWFIKEKETIEKNEEFEKEKERYLTDPDEDESTELGEVPHEEYKGTMPRNNQMSHGFGHYYLFEEKNVLEGEEK